MYKLGRVEIGSSEYDTWSFGEDDGIGRVEYG